MNKKPSRQDFNQKDQNFIKAFNLGFRDRLSHSAQTELSEEVSHKTTHAFFCVIKQGKQVHCPFPFHAKKLFQRRLIKDKD